MISNNAIYIVAPFIFISRVDFPGGVMMSHAFHRQSRQASTIVDRFPSGTGIETWSQKWMTSWRETVPERGSGVAFW